MFTYRAAQATAVHFPISSGGIIGILMLVVSIATLPVSIITYCILKKRKWDMNEGEHVYNDIHVHVLACVVEIHSLSLQ